MLSIIFLNYQLVNIVARVLFSLFSNINWLGDSEIDPFYEGFIKALQEQKNDVMLLRTNEFLPLQQKNELYSSISNSKLIQSVADFNPDVIIAANNHIPKVILDSLDCPIILWTADNPSWYSDKEYIKKNISRYKFFHHGWDNIHVKVCMESFGAKLNQNFCVGHATGIQSKDSLINSNIVFVGTIGHPHNMINFLKYHCKNKDMMRLKEFYKETLKSPLNNIFNDFHQRLNLSDMHQVITGNNRIKTLDAISDLGLEVYGLPTNFLDVAAYSMELALCFNYTPIVSIKDTQDLFNSSKIGVNLYSAHAITSFSWRVPDIMASNACLVSPYKEDLVKFNPYIKMPTFESPQECRELCQKLLKDEVWRRDVVTASHKAIEEHGRFEHMFKTIEEVIDVQLLNVKSNGTKGKLRLLKARDHIKLPYKPVSYVSRRIRSSNRAKRFIIASIKAVFKIIPTSFLRKVYHFILSIKNDLQ